VSTNLLAFVMAAFFEIAGCFAFWVWLRREASPLLVLLRVVSWSWPVAYAAVVRR
jgi:drug/metabolite transporter superfamily protein YnfA